MRKYNRRFSMQDLFMNNELKNIFPQFTHRDKLQNVYNFEWVNNKVENYLLNALGGYKQNGNIVVYGKYKDQLNKVKNLQPFIETMFNNIPAITKNIRKNTKLITPFQSIEQLKNMQDPLKKLQAMQIIFDNLNYNPDFETENRINKLQTKDYLKKQEKWLTSVGYFNLRRYE